MRTENLLQIFVDSKGTGKDIPGNVKRLMFLVHQYCHNYRIIVWERSGYTVRNI